MLQKQKVFGYYGFELSSKKELTGYPSDLNNGKIPQKLKNTPIADVIEDLRGDVIRFTKGNKLISNNKYVESNLNEILMVMPELRTLVGKTQHDIHDYDVMKHSLKVMQKIAQNPEFAKLSENRFPKTESLPAKSKSKKMLTGHDYILGKG